MDEKTELNNKEMKKVNGGHIEASTLTNGETLFKVYGKANSPFTTKDKHEAINKEFEFHSKIYLYNFGTREKALEMIEKNIR